MSRGLGTQQRAFLAALAAIDAELGTIWVWPWAVLNELYRRDFAERDRSRAQAREQRDREDLARLRLEAESGEPSAVEALKNERRLQGLTRILRAAFSSRRYKGRPRDRKCGQIEDEINPSRMIAALAKRGLLERKFIDTNRAGIRITDAGRQVAIMGPPFELNSGGSSSDT